MPIAMEQESDGRILTAHLSGKLHTEDYAHFVPLVDEAVQRHGKVDILADMHDFHGWSAGALWQDIKFDARHFNHIRRLAIVGESTWEKWMAVFCRPFTTGKVRYFPRERMAEARQWLMGEASEPPMAEKPN